MKVYILFEDHGYESSIIFGVYSSYELAEKNLKLIDSPGYCLQIEEYEIDKELNK